MSSGPAEALSQGTGTIESPGMRLANSRMWANGAETGGKPKSCVHDGRGNKVDTVERIGHLKSQLQRTAAYEGEMPDHEWMVKGNETCMQCSSRRIAQQLRHGLRCLHPTSEYLNPTPCCRKPLGLHHLHGRDGSKLRSQPSPGHQASGVVSFILSVSPLCRIQQNTV